LRFFYNPDNEKFDFMFRNIMEVVFPEFRDKYRKGMKHEYLERFCSQGFFMIDATDQPVNKLKGKARLEFIRKESERKLLEIQSLVSKMTPIFLITKNVFADYVCVGEGIEALPELLSSIESGKDTTQIKKEIARRLSRFVSKRSVYRIIKRCEKEREKRITQRVTLTLPPPRPVTGVPFRSPLDLATRPRVGTRSIPIRRFHSE